MVRDASSQPRVATASTWLSPTLSWSRITAATPTVPTTIWRWLRASWPTLLLACATAATTCPHGSAPRRAPLRWRLPATTRWRTTVSAWSGSSTGAVASSPNLRPHSGKSWAKVLYVQYMFLDKIQGLFFISLHFQWFGRLFELTDFELKLFYFYCIFFLVFVNVKKL